MKKLLHFISILAFISFILPNIVFAYPSLNPFNWGKPAPTTYTSPDGSFTSDWLNQAGPSPSANAQTSNSAYNSGTGITGLFPWISSMLRLILPLIVSVAVVWFVYSIFEYTIREGEEEKEKAKTQIVWGIIGIFVMVSVWGLVNILQSTFNLSTSRIDAPIIRPGSF